MISEKVWGVWRRHDLRSREIGHVSHEDVQVLRLRGHLKALGCDAPQRLVWSGPALPLRSAAPNAEAALETVAANMRGASLLERVIVSIEEPRMQSRLLSAAMTYAADMKAACLPTASAGMNWAALTAGTRIDGGRYGRAEHGRLGAMEAFRRMEDLHSAISPQTLNVLQVLIVDRISRTAFCRHFSVGNKAGEAKALAALRYLATAYDNDVKRPEPIGQRSS